MSEFQVDEDLLDLEEVGGATTAENNPVAMDEERAGAADEAAGSSLVSVGHFIQSTNHMHPIFSTHCLANAPMSAGSTHPKGLMPLVVFCWVPPPRARCLTRPPTPPVAATVGQRNLAGSQ